MLLSQDIKMKRLIDLYEDDAYAFISDHISQKAIEPFTKFLCNFCLEDEAKILMDVMGLKRIHIAALERDNETFYDLIRKEDD